MKLVWTTLFLREGKSLAPDTSPLDGSFSAESEKAQVVNADTWGSVDSVADVFGRRNIKFEKTMHISMLEG